LAATETRGSVFKGKAKRRTCSVSGRDRESVTFVGGGGEGGDEVDSDPEESETPWTCTLYVGPPVSNVVLPDPFNTSPAEEKRKGGGGGHKKGDSISGSKSAFVLGSEPGGHNRLSTSVSAHQFPTSANSLTPTSATFGGPHRRYATEQPALPRRGDSNDGQKKGIKIKLGTITPAPYHPKVVCQLKMPFPLPDVNVTQMKTVGQGETMDRFAKGGDLILSMEEIKDVVCVTGLWLVVREGFGGLEGRRRGDGWKIRG